MSQCHYITQNKIKAAFKEAIENNKMRITKYVLLDKIAKILGIKPSQLKANHSTAFCVCYMRELDWFYKEDRDEFVKIYLNLTAQELLKGMKNSQYSRHQIDDIKLLIVNIFYGKLTSANVDFEELTLTNKEKNRTLTFRKSDL